MVRLIDIVSDGLESPSKGQGMSYSEVPDAFISVLGYETRSTFLAKASSLEKCYKLAFAFPSSEDAAYTDNKAALEGLGFDIVPYNLDDVQSRIDELVEEVSSGGSAVRLVVDISSMSRPMIAKIVLAIVNCNAASDIRVYFCYCPAAFIKPSHENAPVTRSEPVVPELAGWSVTPESPITAIIGIGYEYDWALGAIEFLEPATAWAFMPAGEDPRFDREVNTANKDLLNLLPDEHIHRYSLARPSACLTVLENLVYGLKQNSRPILVPFGPKLFTLVCIIVAIIHAPRVTVWRVSGDAASIPDDREASGDVVYLDVAFLVDRSVVGDDYF